MVTIHPSFRHGLPESSCLGGQDPTVVEPTTLGAGFAPSHDGNDAGEHDAGGKRSAARFAFRPLVKTLGVILGAIPGVILIATPVMYASAATPTESGTLAFYLSGEDLATQGFTEPKLTKDGWSLGFDHIFVTVTDIVAYQTQPPFAAAPGNLPEVVHEQPLPGVFTVDLVAAADSEDRVRLDAIDAVPGHYNALSWRVVPADSGPHAGWAMVFMGTAEKEGERVPFRIESAEARRYLCGEYVGDERKGWLTAGGAADLEMTLHLDHIFGRADKAETDPLNVDALGIAPFLSTTDASPGLRGLHIGHVGEGHCLVDWE